TPLPPENPPRRPRVRVLATRRQGLRGEISTASNVRCLPIALVAGDDLELDSLTDGNCPGAVGNLGAVEEEVPSVGGPDGSVALRLVELGDRPSQCTILVIGSSMMSVAAGPL